MPPRNECPDYSAQFREYWRAHPMPRGPGYVKFVLTPEQAQYERDVRAVQHAGLKKGGALVAANAARKKRAGERAAYFAKTRISA
jgi:hypothetical protein